MPRHPPFGHARRFPHKERCVGFAFDLAYFRAACSACSQSTLPSMKSGMHGRSQRLAPEWSCCLAFGFLAGSTCCLSAEADAVACLLRPDLYEEALTCLAGRG